MNRATHNRKENPKPPVLGPKPKKQHPGELSPSERAGIVELLTSEEYRDISPTQVYYAELDKDRYHASKRTMYRILEQHAMNGDRRPQATHPKRAIPELVATKPDDVWSWDITKLRGPTKGIWYHGYVAICILSRFVPCHRVERVEDGELAKEMVSNAIWNNGRVPGYLHADGGAAMTSKALSSFLTDMDINRTHSRPKVSNDNPYSEAQFKTTKYHRTYPEKFDSIGDARTWLSEFLYWYNYKHYHSGIGYYTPADVYFGTAEITMQKRQRTLDRAYAAHPERFHKRPKAAPPPTRATINDPKQRKPELANT
jgi:putative transposase